MKKTLTSIAYAFIVLTMICAQQIGRFDFAAYYNGKEQAPRWTQINIYDGTTATQNAGIIQLANPEIDTEQSSEFSETVFKWEYSGNYYINSAIKFNFLPLQAYLDGTYYIPEHSFTIHITETEFINLEYPDVTMTDHIYDNMYTRYNDGIVEPTSQRPGPQTVEFAEKTDGNYPYPAPYDSKGLNIELNGSILRAVAEEGGKINSTLPTTSKWAGTTWIRRGTCVLTIGDHETEDGEYDYVANITVTTWINN